MRGAAHGQTKQTRVSLGHTTFLPPALVPSCLPRGLYNAGRAATAATYTASFSITMAGAFALPRGQLSGLLFGLGRVLAVRRGIGCWRGISSCHALSLLLLYVRRWRKLCIMDTSAGTVRRLALGWILPGSAVKRTSRFSRAFLYARCRTPGYSSTRYWWWGRTTCTYL